MRDRLAQEFWRLMRFSAVGALATAIHIGLAMACVAYVGLSPMVATVVGFFGSFLFSYVGHFRFTFMVPGRYRDYIAKFAVSSAISFAISTGTVWLATSVLGIDYRPAMLALAVIVPLGNYLVNRFWVFMHPGAAPAASSKTKPLRT
ncbi:GtrA family protein [Rhodopseudomonas palustris]|uniref:GtrA family protein n=1 Tax=Rhodopseudomonas palustris TaxID=1076 RepID=UPI0006423871|nr:GtrA family protein [Rhodopseudomonas palustris]